MSGWFIAILFALLVLGKVSAAAGNPWINYLLSRRKRPVPVRILIERQRRALRP